MCRAEGHGRIRREFWEKDNRLLGLRERGNDLTEQKRGRWRERQRHTENESGERERGDKRGMDERGIPGPEINGLK